VFAQSEKLALCRLAPRVTRHRACGEYLRDARHRITVIASNLMSACICRGLLSAEMEKPSYNCRALPRADC